MKTTIPAVLLSALALPASAQLTFQAGNYTTSITGATFVHNGGAIPGLSTGEVAQCGSSHIHAVITGFGNPNTTCGHGTPIFLSPLTVAPSGVTSNSAASMLSSSGSIPNTAAGQLALTRPNPDFDPSLAGDFFVLAFATLGKPFHNIFDTVADLEEFQEAEKEARAAAANPGVPRMTNHGAPGFIFSEELIRGLGAPEPVRLFPTDGAGRTGQQPTVAQEPAAPAPPAAANQPPGAAGQPAGSILDSLQDPKPGEVLKAMNAPLPESEKTRDDHNKADRAVDKIFSGTPQESDAAKKLLPFLAPEVRRLVERKINERVQRIISESVRAGTNAAAGPPRTSN
jgi:hypothetical protein